MLAYCHFLRCFHADGGEREQDHLRFASFFGFKVQLRDIVMLGLFKDVNVQLEKSDSPLEISSNEGLSFGCELQHVDSKSFVFWLTNEVNLGQAPLMTLLANEKGEIFHLIYKLTSK